MPEKDSPVRPLASPFANFCYRFDFTVMLKDMFCAACLPRTHMHTQARTHTNKLRLAAQCHVWHIIHI